MTGAKNNQGMSFDGKMHCFSRPMGDPAALLWPAFERYITIDDLSKD